MIVYQFKYISDHFRAFKYLNKLQQINNPHGKLFMCFNYFTRRGGNRQSHEINSLLYVEILKM